MFMRKFITNLWIFILGLPYTLLVFGEFVVFKIAKFSSRLFPESWHVDDSDCWKINLLMEKWTNAMHDEMDRED